MSVVRLEITVRGDNAAYALARGLSREYVTPGPGGLRSGWDSAVVTVMTDSQIGRDRAILAAAEYFLPDGHRDHD